MQEVGRYRTTAFSHPLITQAANQVGGWQALCESDNLVADRVHFLRFYKELVRRETAGKVSFPILQKPSVARSIPPKQIDNVIQALEEQ